MCSLPQLLLGALHKPQLISCPVPRLLSFSGVCKSAGPVAYVPRLMGRNLEHLWPEYARHMPFEVVDCSACDKWGAGSLMHRAFIDTSPWAKPTVAGHSTNCTLLGKIVKSGCVLPSCFCVVAWKGKSPAACWRCVLTSRCCSPAHHCSGWLSPRYQKFPYVAGTSSYYPSGLRICPAWNSNPLNFAVPSRTYPQPAGIPVQLLQPDMHTRATSQEALASHFFTEGQ